MIMPKVAEDIPTLETPTLRAAEASVAVTKRSPATDFWNEKSPFKFVKLLTVAVRALTATAAYGAI